MLDAEGKSYIFWLFSFYVVFFPPLPALNREAFKSLVFMLQANANKRVKKLAGFWMYAENHKCYRLSMLSERNHKELD